ncbi:MAG: hypothetical protein GY787_08695 [Alteromonadales bacterium]|nr:hypothetical protein [Alteromonadales bacterium]
MINKFNLQFFAEESEVVNDTPVETTNETVESNVDDSQTDTKDDTQPDYSDMLSAINSKAIYKGEPMNIESFDDVIEAVQMRQNYQPTHDRMSAAESRVQELENSAQRKYMNEFVKNAGFNNFAEYKDALDIQELVNEGMSEERASEYINGQKALSAKQTRDEAAEKEANKQNLETKQGAEAVDWFKDNGYGDLTADKIDAATWDKVDSGIPLKYALLEQKFSTIKGDAQQETLQKLQNKTNNSVPAASSTNNKQSKGVWDMSDAEFDKQRERIKRGY